MLKRDNLLKALRMSRESLDKVLLAQVEAIATQKVFDHRIERLRASLDRHQEHLREIADGIEWMSSILVKRDARAIRSRAVAAAKRRFQEVLKAELADLGDR